MGGMKDYMRGYKSGYSNGFSRIPTTFTESVGFNAGRDQRNREQQRHQQPNAAPTAEGVSTGTRVLFWGMILFLIIFVGIPLLLTTLGGGTPQKLITIVVAIVAICKANTVRRLLGPLTPIYIGVMIGLIIGCLELLATGGRLGLYNLAIFLFLGACLGALGVPFSLIRSAKARSNR